MVKGFDTTKNDPTKIVLDYLFAYFGNKDVRLSCEKSEQLIKYWIKNSELTSRVYQQFDKLTRKPKIILKKLCPKPFRSNEPRQGDQYFAAYQNDSQIHICLNNIANKIELKQNLDRQLYSFYLNSVLKQKQTQLNSNQKDRVLMQNLYESCQKGYENYGWQPQTTRRIASKCALYLFRRRSTSNLPPDSLFRYSSKLAEQVCL